jgi:hypothetical protein
MRQQFIAGVDAPVPARPRRASQFAHRQLVGDQFLHGQAQLRRVPALAQRLLVRVRRRMVQKGERSARPRSAACAGSSSCGGWRFSSVSAWPHSFRHCAWLMPSVLG